jgi:hypothetical protein
MEKNEKIESIKSMSDTKLRTPEVVGINYLSVLKLAGTMSHDYCVVACSTIARLHTRRSNIAHTAVVCTIKTTYSVNAWKLIKQSVFIKARGKYFNTIIAEQDIEQTFVDILLDKVK